MDDIDTEVLITLVEARPVLWNKFLAEYKDRDATKDAWQEVYEELNPDFNTLDVKQKQAYGKDVTRRWANIRDSFSKCKKRIKSNKTSGSQAPKFRKYVYFNQLQFLNKVYNERETVDSFDQNNEHENEGDESLEIEAQASGDDLDVSTPAITKSNASRKRKRKEPDEVELRFLKAIEGEKPCSKMSYFQSLMPHLQKFDDGEFFEFQMGVLKVIGDINERKKIQHSHPPHHSFHHASFSTYPQPHLFHPSTQYHQPQQFFNAPNPPPFHREQLNSQGNSSMYNQMPTPNQPHFSGLTSPESDDSISLTSMADN